jgi:hypothetical protein
MSIYDEIQAERQQQDEQWGGPDHDDNHMMWDWYGLIVARADRAAQADQDGEYAAYRRRLIQTAALAVAAVESFDRQGPR